MIPPVHIDAPVYMGIGKYKVTRAYVAGKPVSGLPLEFGYGDRFHIDERRGEYRARRVKAAKRRG